MRYALSIDHETGAVLSATYEQYAWEGCTFADHLPEGDVTDYDFRAGEYVLNEERKAAREAAKKEAAEAQTPEEIYAEALNLLGVQTEEVANDAE